MVSDSIVCFLEFHEPLVDSIREPNSEEEHRDSRKNHSLPIAVMTIIHSLDLFWLDFLSSPCLKLNHLFILSLHALFTGQLDEIRIVVLIVILSKFYNDFSQTSDRECYRKTLSEVQLLPLPAADEEEGHHRYPEQEVDPAESHSNVNQCLQRAKKRNDSYRANSKSDGEAAAASSSFVDLVHSLCLLNLILINYLP